MICPWFMDGCYGVVLPLVACWSCKLDKQCLAAERLAAVLGITLRILELGPVEILALLPHCPTMAFDT